MITAAEPTARYAGVRGWWTSLQRDPGARAQLRRSHSAVEAATTMAALDLARRIGAAKDAGPDRFVRACDLARVLAWVREDHDEALIHRVGWSHFPRGDGESLERPKLSEARFRRLLRSDDTSELAEALIRMVRLADSRASVSRLAADFMTWSDDVKRRWAYDYYAASSAAPTSEHAEETSE